MIAVRIAGRPVPESALPASWPWEPAGAGCWTARAIPDQSEFRLVRRNELFPALADASGRRIEFDTGRLEIEWP